MRKLSYITGFFLISLLLAACGAGVSPKVDFKAFENKEELQKIYNDILGCMGNQSSKVHEVTFNIDNPADKGKEGDAYLYIMADVQDPNNPKGLYRQLFHGELGYWTEPQTLTVDVRGSEEEKMNFRLEDELFDFKAKVSVETLNKIIQEAYAKGNTEPDKFSYRYVERVRVNMEGYRVDVSSKLAVNDQMIDEHYKFDLDGNILE